MRTALAVISVIVLAIHAVVVYDQLFAPWQEYQQEYFDEAADLTDNETIKATLAGRRPAVEQTIVRSFGPERVDRCTSCHIAVEDPRFAEAAHPLRSHPEIPGHRFERFGCTICHDGQGRAVDEFHAHEGGHDWPWPLLPAELIQANCVQCHTETDWEHAPAVHEGRRLFFERACYTCHTIAGLSYGSIGPELTDVGQKKRWDYIDAKIKDPRSDNPTSTMPRQDLNEEERMALVAFLEAQKGRQIANAPLAAYRLGEAERPAWLSLASIVGEEAAALEALSPEEQGEKLLPAVGCLSCHKLDDRDGRVGPELTFTAVQRDHEWLMTHFVDPKGVIPGSLMPPYPLPQEAFDALSLYLLARPLPEPAANPADQYAQMCARCHGDEGGGDGLIAEYLDPAPRDLTKTTFMRTKSRERLMASLVDGVPGTSMAPWGEVLGEDDAARLLDHVLATYPGERKAKPRAREIPDTNPVEYSPESIARGEAIYLDRCWGCHGKKADGHGPNAEDFVPRPRNLRNTPFIESLSYARLHESIKYGVQGTAMPAAGFDFALDDRAIGDLVNFIESLNQPLETPPTQIANHVATDSERR
jgi:mono/diheme cytochrome c family protein